MKRRPRKIITRAIVFLFAGAIVNVAVAWGIAFVLDAQDNAKEVSAQFPDLDHGGVWHVDRWDRFGCTAFHALYYADGQIDPRIELITPAGFIPWWSTGYRDPLELFGFIRAENRVKHLAEARGFPIVTMWQEFEMQSRPSNKGFIDIRVAWKVHGGIPVADGSFTPRSLPLRPIFPGFAINTIFYAAVLWLLFAAPGFIRKWKRIKRGLCPASAYPIGTSDICTECGQRVRS